jgi:hypothetical protein
MKPSEIIKDEVKKRLKGQFQTQDWYRMRLFEELESVQKNYDVSDNLDTFGLEVGKIYYFNYVAKFPNRYPYYDRFPLAIILGIDTKSGLILGGNFHYLNPSIRGTYALNALKASNVLPDKCLHSYYPQGINDINRVPDEDVKGCAEFITEYFVNKYNQQVKNSRVWAA